MWVSKETNGSMYWKMRDRSQDQAGFTTVNTSDIHTRARTRLLTEWQERWNDSEMGRYCYSICMDGFHGRRKGLFDGDVKVGVQPYGHSVLFAKDK
jgi:hypothetical protein